MIKINHTYVIGPGGPPQYRGEFAEVIGISRTPWFGRDRQDRRLVRIAVDRIRVDSNGYPNQGWVELTCEARHLEEPNGRKPERTPELEAALVKPEPEPPTAEDIVHWRTFIGQKVRAYSYRADIYSSWTGGRLLSVFDDGNVALICETYGDNYGHVFVRPCRELVISQG